MTIIIDGNNTGTAGGASYGTGTSNNFTAAGTTGQVLTSQGAAAPIWSTPTTNAATGVTGILPIANGGTNSLATPTAGGVVYGTGTAHAISAAGTTGQVLTSAAAGAPTWTTPSAGSMTLISTLTASSSASLIYTGLSTYNNYLLVIDGLVPSVDSPFKLFLGYGATPTYSASDFTLSWLKMYGAASLIYAGATATIITLAGYGDYIDSTSITGVNGSINFFNILAASKNATLTANIISKTTNVNPEASLFSAFWPATPSAITAIKITPNFGNIATGKVSLYGITS